MPFNEYIQYIQQHKYAYSVALLVLFYILSKLIVLISGKIILNLTKKTKTEIDDLIVKRTNKPVSIILLLIGIRLSLLPLGIRQNILDIIENSISSLIILTITYIMIVVFDIFIDSWGKRIAERTKSSIDEQLLPLFHRFSKIFFLIVGLLFILPVWGIQIGPLLTSLGIAGIAIAFALQSTLGNIFGGMSIILDKSVKVGDKIKLDADAMGTVIDVGLRSTKIKTWDGELITIPNGKLADSKILNFVLPDPPVRAAIDFGVEYGSDPAKVRRIVLDVIRKLPGVIKEPAPKVPMIEMGDFSIKFKALFWVENFDIKFDIKAHVTEEIYQELRKAGIQIPFPTRTVYLKEEK